MTIETDYFDWLCSLVDDQDFDPSRYQLLFGKLYHTEFRWTIQNDRNRACDGEELRDIYADITEQDSRTVRMALNFPCTILEMMIALARRCENQIMEDLFVGPRVGRWIRAMLKSMGLVHDVDDLFDEEYVDYIIDSFLDRTYEYNGDGGLFKVDNPPEDMRNLEIWYQMNLYLRGLESA